MKKAILFLLLPLFGWSQSDTTFSFDEYIQVVKMGHPIARQAELQSELGELAVLKSKGGADPKAFTDFNQKQFDDKSYYNLFNAGLKVPTWFGASFEAGYEQNQGDFLNPESNTPDNGLLYAGVSLPLGKGLFIDQRRATLRKAKLYSQTTLVEQQQILNDLLLEAGRSYWNWFKEYNNVVVFKNAYTLAEQRYLAVKQEAKLGDRPTIDTLEAGIQRQTREVALKQAYLDYNNAQASLEVYLWQDGYIPLELDSSTTPSIEESLIFEKVSILSQFDTLIISHPDYAMARLKLEALEVERKLQSEMLKPELNLKYNALSYSNFEQNDFSFNNYTFGVEFSMPLFLRKERGDLQMTKVKIEQGERFLDQKRAQLNVKVEIALNEWRTVSELIGIQNQTVDDYNNLLAGERSLFESGESSLFMVNSREMSLIQSQVKLNDLISKRFKSEIKVNHALGILNEIL